MFLENLQKLEKCEPILASLLQKMEPPTLSFSKTRQGEINLLDEEFSPARPLHAQYSIDKEINRWLGSLELKTVKVLFIYGIGLGYAYTYLKSWLQEDEERYLVFIEDDLRVFYRLIETELGEDIIEDEQVMLIPLGKQGPSWDITLEDLAYYFVKCPYKITALPSYEKYFFEKFVKVQTILHHSIAHITFGSLEFLNFGASFYQNFYYDMLQLENSFLAHKMFGKFEGVPAVICGAGPSLNKNFDLLKTLRNRALIFAGGSAITALTKRGLNPHFGGSVDPNIYQYDRLVEQTAQELPMFVKSRVNYDAFRLFQGPKIYLCGNSSYPLTNWMEERLGFRGKELVEGHNILHLLINVAVNLGCNPIIFTGMDLAYTGMQMYSDGVLEENKRSKEELTKGSHLNFNAFLRKDIEGNPVYTLWKWVAESDYTSKFAQQYPQLTFINATEGGLGFEGVPNETLTEVSSKYFKKEWDLDAQIHATLQQSKLEGFTQDKMLDLYLEIHKSLLVSSNLCKEMKEKFSSLEKAVKKDKIKDIKKISEEINQLQEELDTEIAFEHILNPANKIRSIMFDRQHHILDRKKNVRTEKSKMIERCKAHIEELSSLRSCAYVNSQVMQKGLKEAAKDGMDIDRFYQEAGEVADGK